MLVAFAIALALYMISEAAEYMDSHEQVGFVGMAFGSESLAWLWIKEAYESLSGGVLNWLTLILLEVVIYHFMRQSLQIILKKNVEQHANTFKPFFDAQVRMIKVSTLAFFFESLVLMLGEGLLPIWLFWAWSLFFRALLIGYVIADNYNEQFGLDITQSSRNLRRNYLGICLGLGLPLLLMMQIPLFGTIFGPLVTSVTAAIVLREKSDLHIVGYQMSEKEQKKAEAKAAKEAKRAARKARKKGVTA